MKKLTEDLVEASKAATGNVKIEARAVRCAGHDDAGNGRVSGKG